MENHGDIDNHESFVNSIKQVDVVISAVGGGVVPDQVKIIAAIKQRFLPSEFGGHVYRMTAVKPAARKILMDGNCNTHMYNKVLILRLAVNKRHSSYEFIFRDVK
ncbi:NmrA domain-containing protein [Forsythia ovata]|uniref:NmrA domain-containing protein n=1 Tax=Forsythia ovata TaxID=205694 RepID=A0ABD1WT19_9LAMI